MKEKKNKKREKKLRADLLKQAKVELLTAIEWIDKGDSSWALVQVKTATKLIDVANEI